MNQDTDRIAADVASTLGKLRLLHDASQRGIDWTDINSTDLKRFCDGFSCDFASIGVQTVGQDWRWFEESRVPVLSGIGVRGWFIQETQARQGAEVSCRVDDLAALHSLRPLTSILACCSAPHLPSRVCLALGRRRRAPFGATECRLAHAIADSAAEQISLPTTELPVQVPAGALPASAIVICHLSDLHLGPAHAQDQETREPLGKVAAVGDRLSDRLCQYLPALPERVHFLVVSGDISSKGARSGFTEFRRLVATLESHGALPPRERMLVACGNQDVSWPRPGDPGLPPSARFRTFQKEIATRFCSCGLPGDDGEVPYAGFAGTVNDGQAEGWREPTADGATPFVGPGPYVFDPERRLLLYSFNSAIRSGHVVPLAPHVTGAVAAVERATALDSRLAPAHTILLKALRRPQDLAAITDQQQDIACRYLASLQDRYGGSFRDSVKIAVMHHHINHLQMPEIRQFESVLDAARFKEFLDTWGFTAVLHGHKHAAHVTGDATVRFNPAATPAPLAVLSAGSVGGGPAVASGGAWSFNLYALWPYKGSVAFYFRRVDLKGGGQLARQVAGPWERVLCV